MHRYNDLLAVNFTETNDKNKVIIFEGNPFGFSGAAFEEYFTEKPVMKSKSIKKQL